MLISVNSHPGLPEFQALMAKTDQLLNQDASNRPNYYATRGGNPLEDDVKHALEESAKGTPFQGTIVKVSGQRFPDIIAADLYGVEVKSTKNNHWTSTGSSILESTRIGNIKKIYMTFGKLGGTPIEFLSRPYQDCLYGIAVTHMPRYLINMELKPGQTIFDKMGVSYDNLRNMPNPITPVADYYRKQLKPGESLWWVEDHADEPVPVKIRLWKNLDIEEKALYTVYGCVNFPEVFGGDYDRYALWLTSEGVVDPHIRDQFSAGGRESIHLLNGKTVSFPAVYRRVINNKDLIIERISYVDPKVLFGKREIGNLELKKRLQSWAIAVSRNSTSGFNLSMEVLQAIFFF